MCVYRRAAAIHLLKEFGRTRRDYCDLYTLRCTYGLYNPCARQLKYVNSDGITYKNNIIYSDRFPHTKFIFMGGGKKCVYIISRQIIYNGHTSNITHHRFGHYIIYYVRIILFIDITRNLFERRAETFRFICACNS